MDYNSVDSEIMESLDFLSPPVKRTIENIRRGKTFDCHFNNRPKNIELLGDFRNNLTKHAQAAKFKRPTESSTSLILKKTSEREIRERYSIVSYTNLLRPEYNSTANYKPLIKVTVIPKIEQTQTEKLYRKRRRTTQKVQNTVSNHENSIHTKNLYLVVAGRRREKVYEIKTTESAKFSSDQRRNYAKDEENSITDISNIRQVLQSLNMDKKKKKDKKKLMDNDHYPFQECKCSNAVSGDEINDVHARKSRVRIFGRLGLTEDDRYVMKCAATVDDKPITTDYTNIERHSPPTSLLADDVQPKFFTSFNTVGCVSGCSKNKRFSKNRRDSYIQIDLRNDNPYKPQKNVREITESKESQGTQVNFSINCERVSPLQMKDQTIQCNGTNIVDVTTVSDIEIENRKESQSPLVIISVYPKQDSSDVVKGIKSPGENTRHSSPQRQNNYNKYIKRENNDGNMNNSRTSPRPRPSRSPSPPIRSINNRLRQDNKDVETKVLRTRVKTETSCRQSTVAKSNRRTEPKEKNTNKKISDNNTNDFKKQQAQRVTCNNVKLLNTKKPNIDLKKALVDDYMRRITAKMNQNINSPINEISNVKINIDSENDNYDVLFRQGNLRTDLHITKTVKEAASQKHYDDDDSMENLFLLPENKPRKRSLSNALYNKQAIDILELGKCTSGLNVRDSIEISHRRETTHNVIDTQTIELANPNDFNSDNTGFMAPIKHYKGDQCELPDPMERDKEIRELLGVENRIHQPQPTTSKNLQRHNFGNIVEDRRLLHCLYKRKCEKNTETGISLYKICDDSCNKISADGKAKTKTNSTQYEPALERTSLYQQLILNRNIQVFLQVEQFTKQKPIILTRKQYDKVKKTIQKTISKKMSRHEWHAKCQKSYKCSMIFVGEVQKKNKQEVPSCCDCYKQTQTKINESTKRNSKHNTSKKNSERFKISIEKRKSPRVSSENFSCGRKDCNKKQCCTKQKVQTLVLFEHRRANRKSDENPKPIIPARQTLSSMEIHYASVSYMKHITFSSTNVGSLSSSSFAQRRDSDSLHTIFKGHKKSVTPNLGTSAFSLLSDENDLSQSVKFMMDPASLDSKPKKPFLRRLMSCLVMRSRASDVKILARPEPQPPSVNSSIDSYHISTSLGAVEVSSSMYDTSASFYSNHTIYPIANNKMKRGFFSSVRGFLTSRKS